jgi:hypothetical protein
MTSDVGASFYQLGLEYQHSGDLLLDHLTGNKVVHLPACFLYSHAAELFMKSFLALKGVDQKQLRSYGHKIADLYDACEKHGLTIVVTNHKVLRQLIVMMTSGHSEYQFRYSEKSFNTATTSWMKRDLAALAAAVGAEVEKQRKSRETEANAAGLVIVDIPVKIIVGIGP